MFDLDNISHNCCPWLKVVSCSWPKVMSLRSRSQCTHTKNSCPGHNSSLPCLIWIMFHTIVVHDPKVVHDLDPRSYLPCQGHCAHILKICVRAITPHCHLDLDNISHNCCPWPKGVSWPWSKVISPRSRSQCIYTENPCPGLNSSLPCWIWIIFHTVVVHDPRVCYDLEPRSYLQGQGHSAHIPQTVSGP